MVSSNFDIKVLDKASEILAFELNLLELQNQSRINIPVYLCIGQEYVASTLASILEAKNPAIFAQHRSHSYFLAFGGDKKSLLLEIMGDGEKGCARGYGGSVGIYSKKISMFGHSGIMGEQGYLGVGYSLATNRPTIIVFGDATLEEDYIGPILGFCKLRNLPVLFICEDNGLAILTPTYKRRTWSAKDLAEAYGLDFSEMDDDPYLIESRLRTYDFSQPLFLNIRVQRKNRHVGAILEGDVAWDRESLFIKQFVQIHGGKTYQIIRGK